jgi:adenine/guanine phosphoribosyltransferase-like PRPP-binding protein
MAIRSNYLSILFSSESFHNALLKAKNDLKGKHFDAFAVRGSSGMIFGGALAELMGKQLILVRKPKDSTHAWRTVEGDDSIKTYIFVDDCIDTGHTFKTVYRKIRKEFPKMKIVGAYLYSDISLKGFNPIEKAKVYLPKSYQKELSK